MAHHLKTLVAPKVFPELYTAFISAIEKKDSIRNLSDAPAVCGYLESFYTLRKPMSSTINTLANVLQKVFRASSDPTMEDVQHAFFGGRGCFDRILSNVATPPRHIPYRSEPPGSGNLLKCNVDVACFDEDQ
ncbi:hypothetical protein V6N13_005374 [Hibiscus sabdariffa]